MLQCWAQKPDDRPTFVALREFLLEVCAPPGVNFLLASMKLPLLKKPHVVDFIK